MNRHRVWAYRIAVIGILCGGCAGNASPPERGESSASTYNPMQHNSYGIGQDPELGTVWRVTARDGVADSDVVKVLYEPDPAHLPQMASGEAVQTLDALLPKALITREWGSSKLLGAGWSVARDGIRWSPSLEGAKPVFYPFSSMDPPRVIEKGVQRPAVKIGRHEFSFEDPNQQTLFVNALYVLSHSSIEQEQAAFEVVVKTYRSQNPQPTLSEDIRRLAVQADTAATDGKYKDAIQLYGQILARVPWWPKAHYNMAVLLAEQSDFTGAIQEMRRYLALAPEASDARAAQDMVYQWEYRQKTKTEK